MCGSWDRGRKTAGAAALAVEQVNADKSLLAGRRLEYCWADSGCSAQQGLTAIGELLAGESRINTYVFMSYALIAYTVMERAGSLQ